MASIRGLFATDLDGTLVHPDRGIHPADRAAISRARAEGVVVTLATGRLTSLTHPVARDLGLDAPMVCADGAIIASAANGKVIDRKGLAIRHVETALTHLARFGLASFVFTHDAIHSCELGRTHHHYIRGWSRDIRTHRDVLAAEGWRAESDAVVAVIGIGERDPAQSAEQHLVTIAEEIEARSFAAQPGRVIRMVARGTSKGSALADIAGRLGVPVERVAAIGDWYNDVSMLSWAGRSFAMPGAPERVCASATDVLDDAAAKRGPIAAALAAWLGRLG